MGENDRELGEITAEIRALTKQVEKLVDSFDKMKQDGCVVGKDNGRRINELEGTVKKLIYVSISILVGGQAGIETVKALFFQ